MNILLHICCAPCAISPIDELRREGHNVTGFFYNPNIHPYSEYIKRMAAIESYARETTMDVIPSDYEIEDYFRRIAHNETPEDRCPICWRLRMERTAVLAKENGFDAFTTTLLGSPYQAHETVKGICQDAAGRLKFNCYYKDFRPGFRQAHDRARSKGIYCQNYCGCLFSEKERIEKNKK